MINEEKVKEMYQMALYDEYKKKDCEDTGKYYEKDYVGGQMIVSFFTGTIAYVCLFAIWSMAIFEIVQAFMTKFNTANITFTFSILGLLYLAFMIVYMFVTSVVFHEKFKRGRRELKKYEKHLKGINRQYSREEKLKS